MYDWLAEWSKALVLGTSLFGGVGSNPTSVTFYNLFFFTFNGKKGAQGGIEPPTSRTLNENHTTRPLHHFLQYSKHHMMNKMLGATIIVGGSNPFSVFGPMV